MIDAPPLLMSTDDLDAEICLLDAFCEDEGFGFAKLDDLEWRTGQLAMRYQLAMPARDRS